MDKKATKKEEWKAQTKEQENRRPLTKAEQLRKERFKAQKAELEAQGYRTEDLTIGLVYANVMAIVLGLPVVIILGICFFLRLNYAPVNGETGLYGFLLFCVVFVILIFVHELIHGIFWSISAKNRWKSISFGFIAKYLTPYCTCSEPLGKIQYIIGAVMPTIILGIFPALAAIATGSVFLFVIGAVMIFAGGGDLTIILKLLRHKSGGKDTIYIDHPYQAGLVAFCR